MTDVWCTCVCCFPRPPTSAHPAGINYTQTPPLPSTKTKKHSLFKAHWMIYTCASPVGVDLRDEKDGRPALEDRGLSFSSAAILLMDAGDGDVCIDRRLPVECWRPNGSATWTAECTVQLQLSGRIHEMCACPSRSERTQRFFSQRAALASGLPSWGPDARTLPGKRTGVFSSVFWDFLITWACVLWQCSAARKHRTSHFPASDFAFDAITVTFCSLFKGEIQSRHAADNNWVCT